jgi:DNA-binding transcriptional ArsR family regulator
MLSIRPPAAAAVPEEATAPPATVRRPATLAEARALAHPVRLRILRLCLDTALTNRQLADRLGMDPGTVHYHVRTLARNGFLAAEDVRHGASGALERPYLATRKSWTLDAAGTEVGMAMIDAFRDEMAEAGPKAVVTTARLGLRLTGPEVDEVKERLEALVEEFSHRDDPDGAALGLYVGLHYRDGAHGSSR